MPVTHDFSDFIPFDALSDEKQHEIKARLKDAAEQIQTDIEVLEEATRVDASVMQLEFTV